jgi:tripartite-type tricarboxylate transporter receptor subunit TctC
MWLSTAGGVQRILHASAIAAGLVTLTAGAQAQSAADKYPDKPIKIIVPFAPGGSADILSRVVGNKLTESFGQTIVVETRPGAGTVIGTTAAAKAEPDGYTLLMTVSNLATNQTLVPNLAYDAMRDFEPISILARAPVTIYVNPKFPPTNIKELIAAAKARPGALNFGSAGPGSMTHLTAEMLKIQAGIEMTHVVYRGGAPALNDVLAGQIPMTFATVSQALAQYQGGLVRALGVAAAKRQSAIPDVPTFGEQGSDLQVSEWYVLLAPAGTPRPIVTKLNAELRTIMAQPGLGDKLVGVDLQSSSPEEAKAYIKSEIERWAPVIRKLGLKPE